MALTVRRNLAVAFVYRAGAVYGLLLGFSQFVGLGTYAKISEQSMAGSTGAGIGVLTLSLLGISALLWFYAGELADWSVRGPRLAALTGARIGVLLFLAATFPNLASSGTVLALTGRNEEDPNLFDQVVFGSGADFARLGWLFLAGVVFVLCTPLIRSRRATGIEAPNGSDR